MSRVDVVIPCYKYAHYLRGCVESVLSQPVDVRVLILDDCSPDNTREVAAELMAGDPRVECHRHAVNHGHIDTYNEGLLEWASGDYCLLLSADDLLTPGALGRAVRVMEEHPEVALVHGRQILFTERAPAIDASPSYRSEVIAGHDFIKNCCELGHNPVATPAAVVRTTAQKQAGGYRKDLPHTADLEMWLRLALRGSVGAIHTEQAFKRQHSQNMQLEHLGLRDLEQRQRAFESFFTNEGARLGDARELHASAHRSVAGDAFWAASAAFERGDAGASNALLGFALTAYPDLRSQPEYKRWLWKKRLGPRTWAWLRPFVDKLRGVPA
jgi:glycosyltransferase involved in cell wall biosynthesis